MIPEITTFTLRGPFKIPGISAHKAPAIPAPKIAKIQTKLSGIKVALNAINTKSEATYQILSRYTDIEFTTFISK